MSFTLGLVSFWLLSAFCPVFAGPIDPSDSLPTKVTGINSDPSRTLDASGAAGSYYCISPADHPDWAGTMDPEDCKAAFRVINGNIVDKDKVWIFWSEKYQPWPPPTGFRLPWGATRGEPFSPSLCAFYPFHSLTMTHSRQLYIGHPHRSGIWK